MSEAEATVPPRARRGRPSSTAKNNPVRRERHREVYSGDIRPPQAPDVNLALDRELDRSPQVVSAPGGIDKDYLDTLAFYEEPVTVMINPSGDENAPMFQECWINGRGIEFLLNDKWRINWPGVAVGYAPVGVEFVTRRKYAEILLRKRTEKARTEHQGTDVENPQNWLRRTTVSMAPMSIISDPSPKGREWLQRTMAS